jgi:hypothetical protein
MTKKRITFLVVVGSLLVSLSSAAMSNKRGHHIKGLVLTARKWKDDKRTLPGSMLYAADLVNNTDTSRTVEAIQMPGGYAGTGRFFNCTLESWSASRGRWVLLWPRERGPTPNPVNIELNPGDQMEVCALMLPAQAGTDGQCVRFKFHSKWKGASAIEAVSNPIRIGQSNTPCRSTK